MNWIIGWFRAAQHDKSTFVWRLGVLAFGVSWGLVFSLVLVSSDDFSSHSAVENLLTVLAMTLIVGPATGWLWGQIMWYLRPYYTRQPAQKDRGMK